MNANENSGNAFTVSAILKFPFIYLSNDLHFSLRPVVKPDNESMTYFPRDLLKNEKVRAFILCLEAVTNVKHRVIDRYRN